jgi:hypothetical protein
MGGLNLIADARAAGLRLLAGDDGSLIVRGPQSAEAIARQLLACKAEVLAALACESDVTSNLPARVSPGDCSSWDECDELPAAACPTCGGLLFWINPLGEARCQKCEPPATALKLLENVERVRKVRNLPSEPTAVELIEAMKSSTRPRGSGGRTGGGRTAAAAELAAVLPPLPPAAACAKVRPGLGPGGADGPCTCPVFWLDAYGKLRCSDCQPPPIAAMVQRRLMVVGATDGLFWEEIQREPEPSRRPPNQALDRSY